MGLLSKRSREIPSVETDSEDGSVPETEELNVEENEDLVEEEEEEEEEEEVVGEKYDGRKGNEMEELEKEYMELRQNDQGLSLENLKQRKDEDHRKGQAVKNQKALWDKMLELRFLLQKAFSSANRLPQEPLRSSFCDLDKEANVAYAHLVDSSEKTLDSLLELQEALLQRNPSITEDVGVNSGHKPSGAFNDEEYDKEWSRISQMHSRVATFRDKSIDKWHRKTQVTTGAAAIKGKLRAFNQSISEQVAAYMRDPSRMIKRMQLRKSTVNIFGAIPEAVENTKVEDTKEITDGGDPELMDDSEFYQQLLKEFLETFDPTSSEAAFYALKRLQSKKRKIVDRRASKSRKIRYNVHEKIVNFMAPQPMNLPPVAPRLFENLFGLKTQNAAIDS